MEGLIAELAERQHGLVARWQLRGMVGPDWIDHKVRRGWLHPLYRAVYAVGHRPAMREARWMGAVLAGGPGAVLSHGTAGAHWGLSASGGPIEVTAPEKRRPKPGFAFTAPSSRSSTWPRP